MLGGKKSFFSFHRARAERADESQGKNWDDKNLEIVVREKKRGRNSNREKETFRKKETNIQITLEIIRQTNREIN